MDISNRNLISIDRMAESLLNANKVSDRKENEGISFKEIL